MAAGPKKIVLIAGPLDDHPVGTHEYEKNVFVIKECLDHSPSLTGVQTEIFYGWPTNPAALNHADTIVLTSGGSDRKETDHPLYVGDHFAQLEKQMKRGCGLVLFHWSNFHPSRVADKITEWMGGYFDYETGTNGPTGKWFSKIESHDWLATPASKTHPICRGLSPFELKEEFYFNLHFRDHDPRVTPILLKDTKGDERENTVAWAVQRANGGRSFGFTGGHYFSNWQLYDFRKMMLNAIIWTAKMEVPADGVESRIAPKTLAMKSTKDRTSKKSAPEKILPPTDSKDSGTNPKEEAWKDNRWNETDLGPFLASTIDIGTLTVAKGLSIRLGDLQDAGVCYDTATINLRVGWTGRFLEFNPARYGIISHPKIGGEIQFQAPEVPPASLQYHGCYLAGQRVVLSYTMDGTQVLESPWFENGVFTRSFEIAPSKTPVQWTVAESYKGKKPNVSITGSGEAKISELENRIILTVPPHQDTIRCKLSLYNSEQKPNAPKASENLIELIKKAPAHWQPITVKGEVAFDTEPYVVDTIPVPYDNPNKALMFITGLDFFANGDAAVCTLHGDVWIVSGIDVTLRKITWRRFATGLFQPLGLKIIKDKIYVLGRDQITVLQDHNKDGEADFYQNFYNGIRTSPSPHEFVTSLETDSQGNIYYVDPIGLHKLSPNGHKVETVAAGWRNPNGASISSDGVITIAPQEGEWTPASAICEVKPGGWYGFGGPRVTPDRPLGYDQPLCWMPRIIDNSTGSQAWVNSDRWGPLQNQLLSFSFGRCSMMMVLRNIVDGQPQGAVVPMKPHFLSGAMRGEFRKQDGQLYVVGTLGWSTSATRDGSFQRVRYTGKKVYSPISFHVRPTGIELGFTQPLDKETAEDPGSYGIEQWNYLYASTYGSKEYSVTSPQTVGHDPVEIQSVKLQPDGHTVFLTIPSLQPVMQMEVKYNINAADGKPIRGEIYNTINRVPKN